MEANRTSKHQLTPGAGAEQFAELFHATYERLAPEFGYTTRTDTRRFDRGSHNGKLMIAVCDYLLTWLDESAPAEIERLRAQLFEARNTIDKLHDVMRGEGLSSAPESRDG